MVLFHLGSKDGLFPSPLFPHMALISMFASQMALLGNLCDSSLFAFPVTSIHAGARDNRHCERECTQWGERKKEEEEENVLPWPGCKPMDSVS